MGRHIGLLLAPFHTYVPIPFKSPPYTDSGFSYLAPFHKREKKEKTW